MSELDAVALDQLFREARTFTRWTDRPVAPELVRRVYELAKFGPTSANGSPARFVFVTTDEARERLRPALSPGNVQKTMSAPVTAIVGAHHEFHESLPTLHPHADARSWFVGNDELIRETAFRNSSLQGAYLILAARALGLDCGPMSGFDSEKVDELFFAGEPIRSNFLCNLGYGDRTTMHPRLPRLGFDEACRVV